MGDGAVIARGKVLAWITPRDDAFLAAVISVAAVSGCPPATQLCPTPEEARQWVEGLASGSGFLVEWVSRAPTR
jgi:hypothetical protein